MSFRISIFHCLNEQRSIKGRLAFFPHLHLRKSQKELLLWLQMEEKFKLLLLLTFQKKTLKQFKKAMPNVTVSLKALFSVKSLGRKSITILCSVSIFWLALLPRVFWTSVLLIRKTKTELVCIMKRWDLLKMRKEIQLLSQVQ